MLEREGLDIRYLVQEAVLFIGVSYILLLGGTFNGLVLYRIKLVTFVLALGGLSVWMVVRMIRKWSFPTTVLDPALVLFLASQAVSTGLSDDPRRSLIQLGQLVLFALTLYAVVEAVRKGLYPRLILKVMILVSGFVIVFGIWELVNWYRGWWLISGGTPFIPPATYRVRAFLGHPNFTAAYLNLVLPLGLVNVVRSNTTAKRLLSGSWVAAVLGLIFFTSSRGGWIGTASVLAVFGFFLVLPRLQAARRWFRRQRSTPWKLGLMISAAGALLFGLFWILRWQSEHPTHPTSWNNILGSRDYIWGPAWDLFKGQPLFGSGPFTFGTEYIRHHSVPPSIILAHAHNYYLNILAESGIIGLAALLFLVGSTIFLSIKSWKQHQGLSRIQLGGLFAALVGVSVHSLVETPQTLPALMVILAVYVGLLASGVEGGRRTISLKARSWVMAAAVIGLLIGWGWSLFSSRPYYLAVEAANQQNELRAAALFETALESDRRLALNWFQTGLNHGKLADRQVDSETEEYHLAQAREAYLQGLALEPNYSVNWMNLGLVYWQEGRVERGLESVRKAVEGAPRQAGFKLTYGKLLEEAGRLRTAEEAYFDALDLQPAWADSAYFRETAFRKQAALDWKELESRDPAGAAAQVLNYLKGGQIDSAKEIVSTLPRRNNPEAYYLKGLIETSSGNLDQAVTDLRTARWMDPKDPWLGVEINLALGEAHYLQGHHQAAAEAYSLALTSLDRYSSFGLGTLGISEYGWYIYYRPAAAVDLLPGFEVVLYPDNVVNHLPEMIASFKEIGLTEEAQSLTERMINLTDHLQ
jgi:tetratricopeptide (TPR) repeat protein